MIVMMQGHHRAPCFDHLEHAPVAVEPLVVLGPPRCHVMEAAPGLKARLRVHALLQRVVNGTADGLSEQQAGQIWSPFSTLGTWGRPTQHGSHMAACWAAWCQRCPTSPRWDGGALSRW